MAEKNFNRGNGNSFKFKSLKDRFSDLPQPTESEPIPTTLNDEYLKGLESYVDALSQHIVKIQGEEVALTRSFTDRLKSLKNRTGEEEARNQFARGIATIRERRKAFREMLYEAHQERRRLWESTTLQKEEDELIRRRMSKLSALTEVDTSKVHRKISRFDSFFWIFLVFQIALIIIFGTATNYSQAPSPINTIGTLNRVDNIYNLYTHIALMVFIGFGYMMSYLKKYGFGAIGYSFLLSAFALQWSIIVIGFFDDASNSLDSTGTTSWQSIELGIDDLIKGLYGATAVLVALGAVLGKLSPLQNLLTALWLVGWYGFNHFLLNGLMHTIDLGGSMEIFLFASSFGLTLSWTTSRPRNRKRDLEDMESRYDSDIFSILGTLFLFILWPSFNAAFAPDGTQFRVVVNTVLSLCTGVIFSFLFSRVFRGGKFKMSDIQRGTLAGGIALGSCTSFLVGPGGAMATGAVAGALSTIAVIHVTPLMYRLFAVEDTIGVVGTYGVPGLIGAIAGIVSSAIAIDTDSIYGQSLSVVFPNRKNDQAAWHVLGLVTSIGTGFVSGASLGFLFYLMRRAVKYGNTLYFTDEHDWEVPTDFEHHIEPTEDDRKVNRVNLEQH